MEITVRIGNEERTTTAVQFIDICARQGVGIELDDWFRFRLCGHDDLATQARRLLDASPELSAAVLLELARDNSILADALAEREAILWAEGEPCEVIDVARALASNFPTR